MCDVKDDAMRQSTSLMEDGIGGGAASNARSKPATTSDNLPSGTFVFCFRNAASVNVLCKKKTLCGHVTTARHQLLTIKKFLGIGCPAGCLGN